MQNDLTFNSTISKDRPMFEVTCMRAGLDQFTVAVFLGVFNGIVGRLHISADSYIHFL